MWKRYIELPVFRWPIVLLSVVAQDETIPFFPERISFLRWSGPLLHLTLFFKGTGKVQFFTIKAAGSERCGILCSNIPPHPCEAIHEADTTRKLWRNQLIQGSKHARKSKQHQVLYIEKLDEGQGQTTCSREDGDVHTSRVFTKCCTTIRWYILHENS